MIELPSSLIAICIASLLALLVLPSRRADASVMLVRRWVTNLLGFQSLVALFMTLGIALSGGSAHSISILELSPSTGAGFGIYVDGTASLMLLMVSIVGFTVARYSVRYLDGEAMQGRYYRWLGFTAGAVSLMVVAGNLLLFFIAWVMTSFGLHQLLLHYRHRKAAHRAAWTKFAISRLGDSFLIAALALTLNTFGTFDLQSLFAQAKEALASGQLTAGHSAIGWLIMLGAVTKSAQFPFHTWLPNTMETPTPVSALMHAGIVNAGGYLIIRMSPLVSMAPEALVALAAIGAITACFGGIVMMTQSSIKRALAYSTIAQMGFMMLQCGLGAFSASMLHILAHSFYKGHAFLSSGSVISKDNATRGAKTADVGRDGIMMLFAAAALSFFAMATVCYAFGLSVSEKSGAFVLAFIFFLALTTWGWRLFALREKVATWAAIGGVSLLCVAYIATYLGVDYLVSPSVPKVASTTAMQFVSFDIFLGFCALFLLHVMLIVKFAPSWLEPLRIHAANGFYIDSIYQRVFGSLAKS